VRASAPSPGGWGSIGRRPAVTSPPPWSSGSSASGARNSSPDELIGRLVERVRPHRPDGTVRPWRKLLNEEKQITKWVKEDLTVTKIGFLLERKGIVVPPRTLARFAVERCGAGRRTVTVRVDDPPPGTELQVDFGRLGLVADGDRMRVCHGLIFTAVFSRHQFRVAHVLPDDRRGHPGLRGGLELLRRRLPGGHPENVPRTFSGFCSRSRYVANGV